MVSQNNQAADKKRVLVPPDGGWGYIICMAATISFVAISAFLPSYGMIFNDFFIELGMNSADVTLLTGVNAVSIAVAGFLTGPLLKAMSMRKLAFLASALYTVGCLGTAFVSTQAMLFFCQGILQNYGSGTVFAINSTALNDYFEKKRLAAISFANTITAISTIIAPQAVKWSNSTYGFQGTLFMVSAVGAMTFVGSSLLQPVAWHMKEVKADTNQVTEINRVSEILNEGAAEEIPVVNVKDTVKADHLCFGDNRSVGKKSSKGNRSLKIIKKSLDWPLLKKYLMTCTCYTGPISIFAETMFIVFLPLYLYSQKWSDESVAFAFSLQGFGDIACRFVLIFSSAALKKLGSHLLYVVGLAAGIATNLILIWVSDYTTSLVIITLTGISRCTTSVLFPLVVSESVSPQFFPLAFGTSMLIYGLSSIALGPLMGVLRDATNDYTTIFYAVAAIQTAAAVAIVVETTRQRQRQTRTTTGQDNT